MARTSSKDRAEAVGRTYQRLVPDLRPVIVYSGPGRTLIIRLAVTQLFDRGDAGARIVICFDMLGEGFDLPYLKVAPTKSAKPRLWRTLPTRMQRRNLPTSTQKEPTGIFSLSA